MAKIEEGVMVVKDGQGWGIAYEDGNSILYDWVAIEDAIIYDPRYCKRPEDVVCSGSSYIPSLRTGKLVHVQRTIEVKENHG